jgi:transcriptional regulator with XRE-family HTH domain
MAARKEQIRDLLRGARARIDPTEVGFRQAERRRSPGLRREDAAVLAGMSLKWYTWLEQGRDINFSLDVLDRVSRALRLSAAEREYLLGLMQRRHAPDAERGDTLTETVWRTVQFVPVPALVMTLRWDIVAWNHLISRIYRDYSTVPRAERNLLRIILTDQKYQSDPKSYDVIARKLLGEFRVDFGQYSGDPAFEQLVEELKQIVPGFEQRWSEVEICNSPRGSLVQHDELGDLSFDRVSYLPEGSTFLRVIMFTPRDPQTARIIDSIRAEKGVGSSSPKASQLSEFEVLRHTNRH